MRFPQTKTTLVFSVSLGGILAGITAADAAQWLELLSQYAPIALCGWLLYVLYGLEKQHSSCQSELIGVHEELGELKAKVAALEAASSKDLDDGH